MQRARRFAFPPESECKANLVLLTIVYGYYSTQFPVLARLILLLFLDERPSWGAVLLRQTEMMPDSSLQSKLGQRPTPTRQNLRNLPSATTMMASSPELRGDVDCEDRTATR